MEIHMEREPEKFLELDAFIAEHKGEKGPLMPIMQKAQDIFGYLPLAVQDHIAGALEIPLTEVYGVATFYSQFSLEPKAKNIISVCMGTACYVKLAEKILDRLVLELGIEPGKTTEDYIFTLLPTRCLGCCGLAPVIMINDDVYGRLSPDEIPAILAKYRS